MRPKVAEMVKGLLERLAVRDADIAAGKPVPDSRPAWRVLRAELWRQYGALIDTETLLKSDGVATTTASDAVIATITRAIAQSLVSQRERIYDLCDSLVGRTIEQVFSPDTAEDEWDIDALEDALREQFNIDFELEHGTADEIAAQAWAQIEKKLGEREQELTRPWFMYFARHFALEEIDNQWIEHLKTMDALREGIGLQGYGQKDPKKEYKKAGYDLFADMMARMQSNVATKLFRVQIQREAEQVPVLEQRERQMVEAGAAGKSDEEGADEAQRQAAAANAQRRANARGVAQRAVSAAGGAAAGQQGAPIETVRRDKPKVGRNDPCPCGSGKKYKKCHGRDEAEAAEG
jgi:preprotein translocase subunit SecA